MPDWLGNLVGGVIVIAILYFVVWPMFQKAKAKRAARAAAKKTGGSSRETQVK